MVARKNAIIIATAKLNRCLFSTILGFVHLQFQVEKVEIVEGVEFSSTYLAS